MTVPDLTRWHTWREIHAQPAIWRDWAGRFAPGEVRDWIAGLGVEEVWFCGAGTSAYIGEIVVTGLEGAGGPRLRAVATTDIVSRPGAYLRGRRPLVVNFGRSGDSAETLGTLDALDAMAPDAPRLNITCNPDGALAKRDGTGPCGVVLLPEDSHDAGFAMTSSFSTMLLSALALFDPDAPEGALPVLADALEAQLPLHAAEAVAQPVPERIVFLGTGPLAQAAREAALKVMELTAGQVAALWDSTLGFRHGPKSFMRGDCAIVLFSSPDPHAVRYEADLVDELRAQYPDCRVTVVGPGGDVEVPMPLGPAWSAPLAVAHAQVLACVWADRLGLNVDDPFAGEGTLSRVVSGVTLYRVAP